MELPIVAICLLLACLTPVSLQQDDCQNKDSRCPNMPKHGREVFCQRPWARRNCEQLCGICGDKPLVVKVSCYDINNRCAEMPHDYDVFCARPWAKRNCKKFCRVCVSDDDDTVKTTATEVTTTTTPTTTTKTPTTTTATTTTTTSAFPTISPLKLCEGKDGVFSIYGVEVLCLEGWVVFQQRKSDKLNFDRSWIEYKQGFGNVSGDNFWLGLDYIHRMCGSVEDKCEVRQEASFKGFRPTHYDEMYKKFYINSESDKFRITVEEPRQPESGFMRRNQRQFTIKATESEKAACPNWWTRDAGGYWYRECQSRSVNVAILPQKTLLYRHRLRRHE